MGDSKMQTTRNTKRLEKNLWHPETASDVQMQREVHDDNGMGLGLYSRVYHVGHSFYPVGTNEKRPIQLYSWSPLIPGSLLETTQQWLKKSHRTIKSDWYCP